MNIPIDEKQLTPVRGDLSGFFIRHAPTDWNFKGLTMGQTDVPLGRRGMELLGQELPRLSRLGIGAIYSSPLKRCLQTAKPLSRELGLPVTCVPELMERNWGILEGRPKSARGLDPHPEEAETMAAFRLRVGAALDTVGDEAAPPLLVTHSGVIRELKRMLELDLADDAVHHLKPIPFATGRGRSSRA